MPDAVRVFIDGYQPVRLPFVYRMRAYDTTLAQSVFWGSSSIDTLGADYTGPGPLSDVVVQKVIRNV
jgi:hypothetical protein